MWAVRTRCHPFQGWYLLGKSPPIASLGGILSVTYSNNLETEEKFLDSLVSILYNDDLGIITERFIMIQTQVSLEEYQMKFLEQCQFYGFQDPSEVIRTALNRLSLELEQHSKFCMQNFTTLMRSSKNLPS